jgi:outer membrane protein OmpA-like peptidoglycan-associated protein
LPSNNGTGNVDILGPAVLFNINSNSSMAIFTRARSFGNIRNLSGSTLQSINNITTDDFNIEEDQINGLGHAWAEFGATYAQVLLDKNQHFLKGGISLKYLKGAGSVYGVGENIIVDYVADGTDLGGGETTGSISSSGFLNYARFADFDNANYDYKWPSNSNGFGGDLGFVYEWRPSYNVNANTQNAKSNYKLKLGVSITDIGFINYKNGIRQGFNLINTNVSEEDFDNATDFGAFLETYYTLTASSTGYKVDLPTAFHFNADWHLNNAFFLNLNTDLSLMSKNRITANNISNIVSLTPRYETTKLSFYLPLSLIENSGFRMGAGLRAGPLYLGSGSLISALVSNNNKEADFYAGLKVGILKNKQKDKDDDGVIDKLDNCPELAGPIENNGCPWLDKDNDGVLDNVDVCPEESGPAENNGCPWKDTDGDGVVDKDDKCMHTFGTIANFGCPEMTEAVQKTLNDYAKVVLFSYGKATIKEESEAALTEIIEILKDYPNAKFTVEGHTDSIGSYETNDRLSEKRANAVRTFLIDNGIDADRLTAIGYGERKPIATNMYKTGRAKNRRVEINLVK